VLMNVVDNAFDDKADYDFDNEFQQVIQLL
jgi:hypothetical protein